MKTLKSPFKINWPLAVRVGKSFASLPEQIQKLGIAWFWSKHFTSHWQKILKTSKNLPIKVIKCSYGIPKFKTSCQNFFKYRGKTITKHEQIWLATGFEFGYAVTALYFRIRSNLFNHKYFRLLYVFPRPLVLLQTDDKCICRLSTKTKYKRKLS